MKRVLAIALLATLSAAPAPAQVPPSATEIAAYRGLHLAAQTGDVAAIERLTAAGALIDPRDGHGRTPLHVATHARQREAMRALVRLGAAPRALDSQIGRGALLFHLSPDDLGAAGYASSVAHGGRWLGEA